MQQQTQKIDFTGTKLFIGIDVHKNSWKVTVRTRDLELKTFSMNPSPVELAKHLTKNYPNAQYCSVYEAGFCGFWIHRELVKLGIDNIVINPADVPTTHKEKRRRTDKVDSRKLARELSDGSSLHAIFVPSKEQDAIKAISRRRRQIRKRITQIQNRTKQFLHNRGIHLPERSEMSHWSGKFIHWLDSLEFEQKFDRYYLDSQLIDLKNERAQMLAILRQMRMHTKDTPTIEYLKTVVGIGLVTAFTFYAEVADIKRFKKFDNLASFLGLVPDTDSSGEDNRTTGITKRYQRHLRYLLVEAAWTAVRKDPALTMAYENFKKTNSSQKAIIKITKKLVNRMRYVWLNQTEYETSIVE